MRVVVVMSTYSGERFVREQVASILSQLPADGLLLVRDDGSTDHTVERIRAFADPRIVVEEAANVGFARSFFLLLASVPADADCVLLADQDDVWLPGKIERACASLAGRKRAALYFSRLQLVDEELRPLGLTARWPRGPSFSNALAENIVTGCTIALNRPALQLVLKLGDPAQLRFHDWWIYLVVSAFGEVVADPTPTMLYRQHGANVLGRGAGWRRYLVNLRFVRRTSWVHIMFGQIQAFRAVHGAALSPAQRRLLDRYFDPARAGSVLRLLLTPRRFRQTLLDEFLLRLLLLWEIASGRGLLPVRSARTPVPNATP
jgi:glycosyltransferase involved in cell wall biosynthesis